MNINEVLSLNQADHSVLGEILELVLTDEEKSGTFDFEFRHGQAQVKLRLSKATALKLSKALKDMVGKYKEESMAV
jgi:hypothetical protein